MARVAIRANRGIKISPGDRFRVNALTIREQQAVTDAGTLHSRLVAMTFSACLGYVSATNSRSRIFRRQDRRHIAIDRVAGLA